MPEVSWQPYPERRTGQCEDRDSQTRTRKTEGRKPLWGEIRKEKVRIRSGAYLGVGLVLEGRGQRLGSA